MRSGSDADLAAGAERVLILVPGPAAEVGRRQGRVAAADVAGLRV